MVTENPYITSEGSATRYHRYMLLETTEYLLLRPVPPSPVLLIFA